MYRFNNFLKFRLTIKTQKNGKTYKTRQSLKYMCCKKNTNLKCDIMNYFYFIVKSVQSKNF